ncbi:hypothetical protein [Dokdonella sp.]|uniref:hypothetical protein n=1 Tax=Dokdonella sp. TaxID=2291710 RepID=UPI0031CBF0DB|nr:hypothetical protein [Dokdonella sp.]
MPEFEGVSLGETLIVAAIGTESGEGEVHAFVEGELLGDDAEGGGARRRMRVGAPAGSVGTDGILALDDLLCDGVRDVPDVIGKGVGEERGNVVLRVGVSPGMPLGQGLLFREREVFLGDRLVVREGREFCGEEFTVSVFPALLIDVWHIHHMLLDSWEEGFILFFRVLLVQDAILLVAEADAAETMGGIVANFRIP